MVAESNSPWFTPMDTGAMPLTEPHPAPIFDTGPHPEPLHGSVLTEDPPSVEAYWDEPEESGPLPVAVPPTVVPGQYSYVKWWKFVLLTFGVWAVAGAVGAGLYYWWFHAADKTWTNFTVLIFVMVCVVVALLLSMVEHRPTVSVIAIGAMTAPFAAGAAAAALYGMYVFGWIAP